MTPTSNSTAPSDTGHQRTIQLESGPNQRLELEISYGFQGRRELVLRELCWGNGVGWFTHKSIRLDSSQLDSLLKALCCLRLPSSLERCCPLADLVAARPPSQGEAIQGEVIRPDFKPPVG